MSDAMVMGWSGGQDSWVDVYVGGRLAAEGVWAEGWQLPPHTQMPLLRSISVGESVELRQGGWVVRRMVVVGLTGRTGSDGQHRTTALMR